MPKRYFETSEIIEFLKLGAMTVNEARGLMGLGKLQDNLENEDFFAHIPELEEKRPDGLTNIMEIIQWLDKVEERITLAEAMGEPSQVLEHVYMDGICIYCGKPEEEPEPEGVDFNAT